MSFVPCVAWVKQGIAQTVPDKLQLSKEELEQIIKEAKDRIRTGDNDDNGEQEDSSGDDWEDVKEGQVEDDEEMHDDENTHEDDEVVKAYGLDDYDDDDDEETPWDGISGLSYYANNSDDPFLTNKDEDDSDEEDLTIKATDNLLVVGKARKECSILEIYVYSDKHSYVHHDIVLPSYPLAAEWLNFDPSNKKGGNFLAIGSLEPTIDIWDLDIVNSVEPDVVLGTKKKKKSKKKKDHIGHSDAVLDLSWNTNTRNVLASASADYTVALWDLNNGTPVAVLQQHTEKVQTVKWHPFEAHSLLTGSFDHTAKVFDCRSPDDTNKSWSLSGEVERVTWNHFSPMHFLASTCEGFVYYLDARMDKPVFTLKAHDKAVSGLCLSSQVPGCLMTSSSDTKLKIWDILDNKPQCILDKEFGLGQLQCLECCPDLPYVIAVGGESDFRIWDMRDSVAVKKHFKDRIPLTAVVNEEEVASNHSNSNQGAEMDVEADNSTHAPTANKLKKKKKKKRKH